MPPGELRVAVAEALCPAVGCLPLGFMALPSDGFQRAAGMGWSSDVAPCVQ